jgi:predicted Zn-ribbon and HTH transcriptional regulator
MQTIREKIIDAIIDLASDEAETVQDVWKYAKMSKEQLICELINIAQYYKNEC